MTNLELASVNKLISEVDAIILADPRFTTLVGSSSHFQLVKSVMLDIQQECKKLPDALHGNRMWDRLVADVVERALG